MPIILTFILLFTSYSAFSQNYAKDDSLKKVWQNPNIADSLRMGAMVNRIKDVYLYSKPGWFFGFKLHLVINELGEIVSYRITTGDVADNNLQLLQQLLSGLKGKCFGDKGYISSLFSNFYENGLKIVTGLRANMKNQIIDLNEAKLLKKRGLIEAVNDILKSVCDLEHSRHRSVENAIQSMHCAVIAYSFLDNKPELILKNFLCAA